MKMLVGFLLGAGLVLSFGMFLFGLIGAFEHSHDDNSRITGFATAVLFAVPALYFCVRFVSWAIAHPLAFLEGGT